MVYTGPVGNSLLDGGLQWNFMLRSQLWE